MSRPDWVDWSFKGALTAYVAAMLIVGFKFPGVSNLWVAILILVSGFFGLLADYAQYRREKRREHG